MRHLYVHVPFCARRCVYCDFAIAVRRRIPGGRFVELIRREREARVRSGEWDAVPLETLYLGGGTPSRLPPRHVGALVRYLLDSERADRAAPGFEITLEANPDDVSTEAVRTWTAAGVTRVSLGVQSFDPAVLEWMHRPHDADAGGRAVTLLRREGVGDVSVDLIFGRPERVGGDVRADLDRALSLEPDHLSVYGLTVEPRTPLGRWVDRGSVRPAPEERYAEEFLAIHDRLVEEGFEHYEVSNYARPGKRARHNAAYWAGRPYAGLGPSAHTFLHGERRWNLREWAGYAAAVGASRDPTAGRERPDAGQRRLERVYLGLRTREGVPTAALPGWPHPAARRAERAGWLTVERGRVRLTPSGWLRLDALVPALTTSAKGG